MTEGVTLPAKPLPRITPDNKPFWDACRRHELALPWCEDCQRPHYPPGPVCPFCLGGRIAWRNASGLGVISSWVVVHKEWFAAFRADIPYNVIQVELEEGIRLTASAVDIADNQLRVGLPVQVVFDDVTKEVTLPRFRPR